MIKIQVKELNSDIFSYFFLNRFSKELYNMVIFISFLGGGGMSS